MQVKKWMTRNPISISEHTLLPEAYRILREYEIRHLPVTSESGRVVGLISDHDIGQRLISRIEEDSLSSDSLSSKRENSATTARDIMSVNLQTVGPEESIVVAALLMHNRKIGCLPVLTANNVLVGILTTNDLLEILVSLLSNGALEGRVG